MASHVLLRATDLTKTYAGVQALRGASFELEAGEVHALVGENGAGKSTLIKILSGAVQPDGGEIAVDGERIANNSPGAAKARGIACIYQQPALFPELTVAENLAIGVERPSRYGLIDWRARGERARQLLDRVGARIDPEMLVGTLSLPQQQLVEIARALGAEARILILDEPTASLSNEDSGHLLQVLRELRTKGVGMIYISHRLEELPDIADRVTVLRDGRTIGTRAMSGVTREALIEMMVGRELTSVFPKRDILLGETILELRNFGCSASGLHSVNVSVRAGEILGVAGLVGAGRTELARAVFGLTPADSGEMQLRGRRVSVETPSQAIEHGLAYVPEDRRHHGVVLEMGVSSNITLASIESFANDNTFASIDFEREEAVAVDYTNRLGVKTPSIFSPVSSLSGGNQQKVALARWLVTSPKLLILDEPTQGIDVGAKAEIHALVSDMAEAGVAVIMISSEMSEIMGMSDRIAVMREGTVVRTFERVEATPALILSSALGHVAGPDGARGRQATA